MATFAPPRFYQITCYPRPGTVQLVQRQINRAQDWYQFENVWIVYTNRDAAEWLQRLGPYVKTGGNVFICPIDLSDRQGWMPKSFWEWLKKPR